MKKILLSLFLLLSVVTVQQAEAKGIILYHNGPEISKISDLPSECEINGKHVNVAVMYKQFGLFWMPVWNYGEVKYVLIDDAEDNYWDVDEEDIAYLNENYDLKLATPTIPFWSRVGLKPIILIIILFAIWTEVTGRKKKKNELAEEDEDVDE